MLARNAYNEEFPGRVAFAACSLLPRSATGDRTEFLGRNGDPRRPAALGRDGLSGRFGAGLDPCAALEIEIALAPGETRDVAFVLGPGNAIALHALSLAARYASVEASRAALREVEEGWDALLGTVQVQHARRLVRPDDERLAGLPDAGRAPAGPLRLLPARRRLRLPRPAPGRDGAGLRAAQTCGASTCCAPPRASSSRATSSTGGTCPSGRGTRTRCSDDLLWLPHAAAHYVRTTGDEAVLDETVPFLEAPPLAPGESDWYGLPTVRREESATAVGALPAGDRPRAHRGAARAAADGQRRLERRHEPRRARTGGARASGWASSCYDLLATFAPLCERARRRRARGTLRRRRRRACADMLEQAWDGEWYRRAYFDDGTPLGSAQQRGVPHRLHRAVVVGALGRRAAAPGRARHGLGAHPPGAPQRAPAPAADAALRPRVARSRLHQGLRARRARERGAVHPRRHLDGDGAGARWAGATRRWRCSTCSTPSTTPGRPPASTATAPSRTWSRRTCTRTRRTRAAAAGPGTPARRDGCTAWVSRACSGLTRQGETFSVDPCIPSWWPGFEVRWRFGRSSYGSRSRTADIVDEVSRTRCWTAARPIRERFRWWTTAPPMRCHVVLGDPAEGRPEPGLSASVPAR